MSVLFQEIGIREIGLNILTTVFYNQLSLRTVKSLCPTTLDNLVKTTNI